MARLAGVSDDLPSFPHTSLGVDVLERVDGDGGVLTGPFPEIHRQLLGLIDVQRKVVVMAPARSFTTSLEGNMVLNAEL